MLRVVVGLLLLANLVFFGWARGWFEPSWPSPHHGEREPQRVTAQLRPDAVIVLAPKAASAAIAAARAAAAVCLQAGPLADAEIAAAEAALAAVQLPEGALQREPAAPPPPWLVLAGRSSDAAQRRAREAELDKLGLSYERLDAPAELAPGLVLSRHFSRAEAESALAVLAAASQPLKGARVVSLPTQPPRRWLRVARADVDQQARLLALPSAAVVATGGGFKPCAAPS
jgi:hypothetical protein